jgi:hypothetical protein
MTKKHNEFLKKYSDPYKKDANSYEFRLTFVRANLYSNGHYIISPSSFNMVLDLKTRNIKTEFERVFIDGVIKNVKKDMLLSRKQLEWLDDLIGKYLFVN